MGAGMSSSLVQVLPSEKWDEFGRGPRLRLMFGAYGNQELWAVQRNFKQLDDGQGYINFEELQQMVTLKDASMLFMWDLFSLQNELVDIREFLSMLCVFSSATLPEKGRFLLALFDQSQSGRCTCAEVSQLNAMVLKVLSQVTGVVIKPKEVAKAFKADLPKLLKEYVKAKKDFGERMAFEAERIVSHSELDTLLSSIQAAYQTLPVAEHPPPGAEKPPKVDKTAELMKASARPPAPRKEAAVSASPAKPQMRRAASALQAAAWLSEEAGLVHKELASPEIGPPHTWVVMHGGNFGEVAKDIAGFSRSFAKSVASALALPEQCVDVTNVVHGSIIVEFVVSPADEREHPELVELLAQQFGTAFSNLRKKSALAPHLAGGATLLEKPPFGYGGAPGMADGHGVKKPRVAHAETQTETDGPSEGIATPRIRAEVTSEDAEVATDVQMQLREALAQLDAAEAETGQAEAALRAAEEELALRDALIEDLKSDSAKSRWKSVGVLASTGAAKKVCAGPMEEEEEAGA